MNDATDFETAVNSLLIDNQPEAETEATEEPQDATEVDDVDVEDDAAEEVEADEQETDEDAGEASEEDDAEEGDDAEDEPETVTVKVDGIEKKVTIDELKRSYSGQEYIQKGMQEAAAKRKEAEATYQALQQEQQRFLETVKQFQEQGFKAPPQKPDPELLTTDPIGYMQEQARYDAEMGQYQAQQDQLQKAQQHQSQLTQHAQQVYLQEQAELLKQRIPELADPEKAKSVKESLVKVGSEAYGFSAEELGAITDARAVQVLHDAAKWRELQTGKAKAQKKPTAPRNVKPGGKRTEPAQVVRKKKLAQAKKSGSLDDFASLLLE